MKETAAGYMPDNNGFINDTDIQSEIARIEIRKKRGKIGLLTAIVAEVLYIIAFAIGEGTAARAVSNVVLVMAIIATVASYAIGGGILTAIKSFFGIIKWSWLLIPIFPIDLIFVILGGIVGLLALIFAPLLYVLINQIKTRREMNAYLDYVGYDKAAQEDAIARQMAQDAVNQQ